MRRRLSEDARRKIDQEEEAVGNERRREKDLAVVSFSVEEEDDGL